MKIDKIRLSDIVYDSAVYPREKPSSAIIQEYTDAMMEGAQFPPIILEACTNRLLDGYHRWKAYINIHENSMVNESVEVDEIPEPEIQCEFHTIPENVIPRLYAHSLSSKHGLRHKNSDRKNVACEQYQEFPGTAIKTIAHYTGVSEPTAKKYIEALIAQFEETKRSVIMRLDMLGWTQQEISDKLKELWPEAKGTGQWTISQFLVENEDFRLSLKTDLDKGHESKTVAQRNALPEILVWAIKLQDESDQKKLDELKIKIQPYDVWNFQGCNDLFGSDYPGRIPGELVAHVLYFFTEPGDLILDPMAGSGTVPDVCLAMSRLCYAYDITNPLERPDILVHDMKNEWPERIKKADLVFWDPPYFDKRDKEYDEASISHLSIEQYLDFFEIRLKEMKGLVRKGAKLVFLMSDWDDPESDDGIFIWHYANMIASAGLKLLKHIQAPLSTQQVHGDIVKKFRKVKRLARLERYLLIAEA